MKKATIILDTESFDQLVGAEIVNLIFEEAPTKVRTRVGKSLEHYIKAMRLAGVDEEMGAIRLIAAEEELVVAIFELLKINSAHLPEHEDFVKKFRDHQVKLFFYPVLSQLRFVLEDFQGGGIALPGLEEHAHWGVKAACVDGHVVFQLLDANGKELINVNPLDVAITLEDDVGQEVLAKLFDDLKRTVSERYALPLRDFIRERADYRNKLLYASDGGSMPMAETLEELLEKVFRRSLRDLLWCLAVLLTNKPTASSWGLVSQFISLYRMALQDARLLKP
jgi:hypothetical protein